MFLRRLKQRLVPKPEDIGIGVDHPLRFTENARGLIHIGAHAGEEAWIYEALKVQRVVWVEGDPALIPGLRERVSVYRKQTAIESLLTERAGERTTFYVTNNDGASSSILPPAKHIEMYPEVQVSERKQLTSNTLDALLEELDPSAQIDCLVIDVQGAELAVLKGGVGHLRQFRYIFAECADFEVYAGCCTVQSLSAFLSQHDFHEKKRYVHKRTPEVGTIFDVLFERCSKYEN